MLFYRETNSKSGKIYLLATMKCTWCAYLSRSNEKNNFSKTKIYFHQKTTPQLLGHIGLQNTKVGEKTNHGRLATIFQNLFDGCWHPLLRSFSVLANNYIWPCTLKSGSGENLKRNMSSAGLANTIIIYNEQMIYTMCCSLRQLKWW